MNITKKQAEEKAYAEGWIYGLLAYFKEVDEAESEDATSSIKLDKIKYKTGSRCGIAFDYGQTMGYRDGEYSIDYLSFDQWFHESDGKKFIAKELTAYIKAEAARLVGHRFQ